MMFYLLNVIVFFMVCNFLNLLEFNLVSFKEVGLVECLIYMILIYVMLNKNEENINNGLLLYENYYLNFLYLEMLRLMYLKNDVNYYMNLNGLYVQIFEFLCFLGKC